MAGIIYTQSFKQSNTYDGAYVDYITNKKKSYAIEENLNLDANYKEEEITYNSFVDYISDANKNISNSIFDLEGRSLSTKGFDENRINLSDEEILKKKKIFSEHAQFSNLYQGVFSFQDEYLIENKLLIKEGNIKYIDEAKLKRAVQVAIQDIYKDQNVAKDSLEFTCGFHYNTEHIHGHIAYIQKDEYKIKGAIPEADLNKIKSRFHNYLVNDKSKFIKLDLYQKLIKDKIREINGKSELTTNDIFKIIVAELPKKGRTSYNSLKPNSLLKNTIDKYIEDELKINPIYQSYKVQVEVIAEEYRKVYGDKSKFANYSKNKESKLKKEIANEIIREAKKIQRGMNADTSTQISKKLKKNTEKIIDIKVKKLKAQTNKISSSLKKETKKSLEEFEELERQ